MFVLTAYNTDSRYPTDIRWREYTGSKVRARQFAKIPKLQFSDSRHGIVFHAGTHSGPKLSEIREITDWVFSKLRRIAAMEDQEKKIAKQRAIYKKASEAVEALGIELGKMKTNLDIQSSGLF